MANQSVSEELFQAIDVIAAKRLSELHYDQTMICTIENTDNADKGEYIVSDTSSTFTAYSDNTKYFTGTKVYVTVPNGDMNNQKMIIGKYVSEEDENFFDYIPPLDDFINITDNLVLDNISTSLLANKGTNTWSQSKKESFAEEYPSLYKDINNSRSYKKLLWSWREANSDIYLANFDRMGISASFKTSLKALGATSGTYGLYIECEVETTSTTTNNSKQRYSFYFDSSDFFGNPYNFGTYYEQQKLFDLSDIMVNTNSVLETTNSAITSIDIYAFQDYDFADSNNIAIPFLKEDESTCELLPDNIWIKDINLCFGFALEDYPEGKVILGCRNSLTYKPTTSNNDKELYLQWAYKRGEGDYVAINTRKEFEEYFPEGKIHWYKYWLDDDVSNSLAGEFWTELLTKKENETYQTEEIIGTLVKQYNSGNGLYTEDVYNTKVAEASTQIRFLRSNDYRNLESVNTFNHNFLPDIAAQQEQLKVIIETKSYDNIIEELTGTNIDPELQNVYDEFEHLITNSLLKDGGKKYESMLQELKNACYDGTELAFQIIEEKYNGSAVTDNKDRYPLYPGDSNDITEEPDPTEYDDYEEFSEDLSKYKCYIERTQSIENFNKAKAYILLVYAENVIYESDILTLSNEIVCPNPADIDLIKGLNIIVDPESEGGYGGTYLIYGENNSLSNTAEATKKRTLTASYKSYVTGEESLDKASSITWYIPLTNTMIQRPESGIEYNADTVYERAYKKWTKYKEDNQRTEEEIADARAAVVKALKDFKVSEPDFKYNEDSLTVTDKASKQLLKDYADTYKEENGYAVITRRGTESYKDSSGATVSAQQIDSEQIFRIKEYYSPFAVNNTVLCKVTKNNLELEASALLTFGIAGSNGTDATFILSLGNYDDDLKTYIPTNSLTADLVNKKYNGTVHVTPHLYDYNNKEVKLENKKIKYEWYSGISTTTEISEKSTAMSKASGDHSYIQGLYESASEDERVQIQTFKISGKEHKCTLTEALEITKENYEKAKAAYDKVYEEAGSYYISFIKGEDGKYINRTEGSTGVDITISDSVGSDANKLCHAILKATIEDYEVTNKWVTQTYKSGSEEITRVDADGNPVLERTIKNVSLTAYLPIPVSFSEYKKVDSPSVPYSIIYDMNGVNPSYYKNKFELFDEYGNEIKDVSWERIIQEQRDASVKDENGNVIQANYQEQFYPTLKTSEDGTEYSLAPQTMFFKDTTGMEYGYSLSGSIKVNNETEDGADSFGIYPMWIQPILIIQNKYGSAMLNSWDGNLIIDEDNNTIMSALVGAGIKNSDNTFSGVLMGEVKSKADIDEKIGLYGFDHGDQSFGFRVDGTAFLGASGKGRIYFDGNTGVIKSGNYSKDNNTGMLIDLNSGLSGSGEGSSMAMYGINKETDGRQGFEIDTTTGTVLNLFVKNEVEWEIANTKSLLKVGQDEYVLQTANFTNGTVIDDVVQSPSGLKIDLKKGSLIGYDFKLNATSKSGKGSLVINSNEDEYPFNINDKLKLAWDGTLNVNDHFKVFPDGAIAISETLTEGDQYYFTPVGNEVITEFSDENAPTFYVTKEGILHAENGYFGGKIAGGALMAGDIEVDGAFYIRGKGYRTQRVEEGKDDWEYIVNEDGSFIGPEDNQVIGKIGYAIGHTQSGEIDPNTGNYVVAESYGIALGNADFSQYMIATNAGIRMNSHQSYFIIGDASASFRFKDLNGNDRIFDATAPTKADREGFKLVINDKTVLHEANWGDYVSTVIARFT